MEHAWLASPTALSRFACLGPDVNGVEARQLHGEFELISWCSYCQCYAGESPPFDDYEMTHVLCSTCRVAGRFHERALRERLRPVNAVYRALREAGRAGDLGAASEALERGFALGLSPRDMMIGLIQPALREIGQHWECGELSVAQEHQFSSVTSALLELILSRVPGMRPLRQAERPRLLLANAEGNYHTLGPRILESLLLYRAIPCFTVLPGLPAHETVDLARALRAPFVGLSVALVEQMNAVRDVSQRLREWPGAARPRLLLGGPLFIHGPRPPVDADWIVCRDDGAAAAVLLPA